MTLPPELAAGALLLAALELAALELAALELELELEPPQAARYSPMPARRGGRDEAAARRPLLLLRHLGSPHTSKPAFVRSLI